MGGRVIAIARWFFVILVALAVSIAAGAWQPAGAQALPKTFHFPHLNLPRIGPPPRPHFGDPGYVGRPSFDYERITSFVSDIAVAANGTLTVHETIRVVALGHSIRHGIFRDLPAYDRDPHGNRSRLRLEILQVKRDGHDEPYSMEMLSHAWRVRIGDAGVEVPQGSHAYEIVYRTNRRIGFFGDYDELYWNVTGNEWRFTIEQAVVSIEFPEAAHILRFAAYTGPMGSRDRHAVAERRSDRTIVFRTTKALDHDEGLTVGVAIAKGAVVEPTDLQLVSEFAHDYRDTTVVLIGLILLTAYYFIVWSEVGRDPDAGPVAPLYAPPAHISPAGARYIMRMGYDRKAFAATLISLAVKGVLTIEDEPHILQHTFTLTRGGHGGRRDLSPTEASVAATLFAKDNEVALTQDNQPQIARAISALKNALHYEFDANYFTTNSAWFGGGVVIVLLSAIAAAYFSDSISDTFLIFQFSAFFGVFAGQFGLRAARHWAATLARHGSRVFELTRALFWTAATLPPIAAVLVAMFFISDAMSPLTIAALAAEGFVACIFYELLKRPTAVGAKLRNELKGFRMFLEMTEKDRLELEHPVNVTPETFEKYLPYAIALDAENAWGHRFESDIALASTAALSNKGYQPGWYSGAYRGANFGGFASSLGSGLGSAAASATFRGGYGSGSGSGGGGSSGGGGGGGGGGGW